MSIKTEEHKIIPPLAVFIVCLFSGFFLLGVTNDLQWLSGAFGNLVLALPWIFFFGSIIGFAWGVFMVARASKEKSGPG